MNNRSSRADGARVLADLNALRAIGAYKTGVHKPTFSEPHMRSLHWLVQRLPEAGLTAEIDGIGNVLGTSTKPGPKLLAGSHLESQNYAGWLDGPLGVVYALEAARVINPRSGRSTAPSRSQRGATRKAISALPRQPVLCRRASPKPTSTPRATATAARPCVTRCARSALPAGRARGRTRAAYRIPRGPYRARRDARKRRPHDRRRHLHRRHLAIPHHLHRRAKPRRHDADGRAQGRRPGAGQILRRDRRSLSRGLRPAHGVDHRPHHPRSRCAQHHPGSCGNAVPDSRRRPRA